MEKKQICRSLMVFFILAFFLGGCKMQENYEKENLIPEKYEISEIIISNSDRAYFSAIIITQNGSITYKRSVEGSEENIDQDTISKNDFSELVDEIYNKKFFSMKSSTHDSSLQDGSTKSITVRSKKGETTVSHYGSCPEAFDSIYLKAVKLWKKGNMNI